MGNDPEKFDPVKWAFFLVAFVILAQVASAFMATLFCMWNWREAPGAIDTCSEGKIWEVLAAALAAALAFAGGKLSGKE